jgi:hypothetical protein
MESFHRNIDLAAVDDCLRETSRAERERTYTDESGGNGSESEFG